MAMVDEKTDDYETAIDNLNEVRPVIGEKWYRECTSLMMSHYTQLRGIQKKAKAMMIASKSIPQDRPYLLGYQPNPGIGTQNQLR